MAHITTLTRAYNDLHNSQANTYSYSGSFETFKESEVKVTKNDSNVITTLTYNSSPSDNTQYSVNLTDKTIHVGGANLASGTLSIFPETDLGDPTLKAPYTAGSAIVASDLTNNQKQVLRKLMEHDEKKLDNNGGTMTGDLTLGEDVKIIFEGATANAHETTITVADPTSDKTITFPDTTGTVVTTGDTGTVTSTMITNDTIVDADVNSSAAIAGTKISPNFGSQNISTTGNTSLAGTNVTGSLAIIGNIQVDNINLNGNEIQASSGNLTIDSAGGTVTVDDALSVTGGTTLQSTLGVTGTSTLSGVTGGAVVTSGTSTSDTKVYSAKRTGEIFYGKDTVEEIQSGELWSAADDKVATTAAIDARIIDLVDDVGGFVPIANELSFPNANPDVNNGAGTLVSIKALSTAYTSNGSGEISISNGTVGNSTVTITGAGANVTYAQTLGIIVETTSTLNTYAFHRQTPDATSTTAVANNATNINTVAGISGNVTTVAGISADVTTVAGKATEIGRLGTAAAVEDMSILGTAAIVEDMSILGTTDVVADMAILGTNDVVADMAILGTNDVVADLNTLGTAAIVTDMDALADVATEIGRLGTADAVADMNTLGTADIVSDMNDLATSGNITAMSTCSTHIASINNASSNISSVNNFGDKYQIASSDPSTDGGGNALAEGDLYFNTSADELKVYNGGAWQGGVTASGNFASVTGNTFTGNNIYNDNVKALFGTGSDLEIYHTSSNASIIKHTANVGGALNNLYIDSGQNLILRSHTNSGSHETLVNLVKNGAVELYWDNNKKFETTSAGVDITGNLVVDALTDTTTNSLLKIAIQDTDGTLKSDDTIKINPAQNVLNVDGLNIGSQQIRTNNTEELVLTTGAGNGTTDIKVNPTQITLKGNVDVTSGIDVTGNITVTGTVDGIDIATDVAANTAKTTNATHTGEVTGGTALTIADNVVDEANLKVSNSPTNGYFLSAQSGNTGGLTWAQVDLTSVDADTVDGIHGASFLRSDANDTTSHHITFNDNAKAKFGTGEDLTIYHNGTAGYIDSTGNDTLFLRNGTSGGKIKIQGNSGEESIIANHDGSVELYYDGSSKLETYSQGITLTGNCKFGDGSKSMYGNGSDMEIYHIADNINVIRGTGPLTIQSDDTTTGVKISTYSGGENMALFKKNGSVDLYYDNNKVFETTAAGIRVQRLTASNTYIELQNSGGVAGYLYGESNNQIQLMDREGHAFFKGIKDGAVELYHDNTKKCETSANGLQITSGDLRLTNTSWTGNASCKITNSSEILYIQGGSHASYSTVFRDGNSNDDQWYMMTGGNFIPATNNSNDIGTSSYRVANIYTNDLHLSNKGHTNDVDGTWGDWTIQEGESDLFLKNNRSGKKYKFNLTEVS